jgi:hypothetical protein
MKKSMGFIAVLIIAVIIGCLPNLKDVQREKCKAMPNDNVMKAIKDNCIKCHTKDFNTKEDVCALKGDIIEMVRTKKMPKMGTLWPSYYKTFVDWK